MLLKFFTFVEMTDQSWKLQNDGSKHKRVLTTLTPFIQGFPQHMPVNASVCCYDYQNLKVFPIKL